MTRLLLVSAFLLLAPAASAAKTTGAPVPEAPNHEVLPATVTLGARVGAQRMAGGLAKSSNVEMTDLVGTGSTLLVDAGFWVRPWSTLSIYYEGARFAPGARTTAESNAHNVGVAARINVELSREAAFLVEVGTALKWMNIPIGGRSVQLFGHEAARLSLGGSFVVVDHVRLDLLGYAGAGSFGTVDGKGIDEKDESGFLTYGATAGLRIDL
jgi:hypothetical protein